MSKNIPIIFSIIIFIFSCSKIFAQDSISVSLVDFYEFDESFRPVVSAALYQDTLIFVSNGENLIIYKLIYPYTFTMIAEFPSTNIIKMQIKDDYLYAIDCRFMDWDLYETNITTFEISPSLILNLESNSSFYSGCCFSMHFVDNERFYATGVYIPVIDPYYSSLSFSQWCRTDLEDGYLWEGSTLFFQNSETFFNRSCIISNDELIFFSFSDTSINTYLYEINDTCGSSYLNQFNFDLLSGVWVDSLIYGFLPGSVFLIDSTFVIYKFLSPTSICTVATLDLGAELFVMAEFIYISDSFALVLADIPDVAVINMATLHLPYVAGTYSSIPDTLKLLLFGLRNMVYLVSNKGIYSLEILPTVIIDNPFEIISWNIYAYPNPFNSSITINLSQDYNFSLKDPPTIEIYDLRGRKVDLVTGAPTPPGSPDPRVSGSPSFLWTPSPLTPSGIYLVKATIGNKTLMKKVIYLK